MQVLLKPLVTEKVNDLNEASVYGFIVDQGANKIQIKKAVEQQYGVNVEGVRTIIYQGKDKTRYTKSKVISGRSSSYKKAYVKLAEGEMIDLYE